MLGRRHRLGLSIASIVLSAASLAGQTQPAVGGPAAAPGPNRDGPPALSARLASYSIDVALDPETRRLDGRQVVRWRNAGTAPATELRFHLYWNAWANDRSTWMLEDRFRGRSDRGAEIEPDDWGWCRVDAIRLRPGPEGGADLLPTLRYDAPDDGNPDDRTVMVVSLPRPVEPGEAIEVELEWQARVPRTFARTGFRGDFYFIAHWFPKLGVWEGDRWHCRQYHAATEYYSDYGVYDVRIRLPDAFVLGATGRLVERLDNGDGTTTHRHVQEDVHGFAWTASPDYLERRRRFEAEGLPPVEIRLLLQGEHLAQADRHFDATEAALRLYGSWYGPYPYGHLTVVDPAWGSGAGGMEYPTLFTSGTRWLNPFGGGSPEGVTIHEAGHQFWYGIVGNDEFDHAWIDEGLNTFSTGRVYEEVYGPRDRIARYFRPPGLASRGFFPWRLDGVRESWSVPASRLDRYRRTARTDVQADPTYLQSPATASNITYSKTALYLATLERHLGWPVLRRILSTFFERWSFRHPKPADFFAVADEASGRDLGWFFDQVHGSEAVFDYAVTAVRSDRLEPRGQRLVEGRFEPVTGPGGAGQDDAAADATVYRTEVEVRRLADGVFPVDVLLVFEGGREVRHRWEGRELWRLYVEEGPERLEYAAVDPERVLLLDVDYTNNSRQLESGAALPAVKWASKWMIRFQDLLATFSFFS